MNNSIEQITVLTTMGIQYQQGPSGRVFLEDGVWRWEVTSNPLGYSDQESAYKVMIAALEGATIINGEDMAGRKVARRKEEQ